MTTTLFDIGEQEHQWLEELKKRYDRRHLLEMQLKLDQSETDKALWEEIELIDGDIWELIDGYGDDKLPEPWLKEWKECTEDSVIKKFHRTQSWSDLSIGFSHHDINIIRCSHPLWGQEFHAKNDFTDIPLIKYDVDEEMDVTSEVYEIMRYFASKDKLKDDKDNYRSVINRANTLLTDFFRLNGNPIQGKTNSRNKSKFYTCKIDFKFLD